VARRRIVFLKDLAGDLRQSVRRRGSETPRDANAPDRSTAEELERRLDETRERLRREIPPPDDESRG
jgi:hypothetical protein